MMCIELETLRLQANALLVLAQLPIIFTDGLLIDQERLNIVSTRIM